MAASGAGVRRRVARAEGGRTLADVVDGKVPNLRRDAAVTEPDGREARVEATAQRSARRGEGGLRDGVVALTATLWSAT